jgi:D-amino-acid oxidase
MTSLQPDVLVIGAGVSGLTTAICLAEAGRRVTVAAADPPPRTTSAAAGAVWGPHLVGKDDRVDKWSLRTLATLTELAADPASGVRVATGTAASRAEQSKPFDWVAALDDARPCDPAELPAGYAGGWRLTVPIVSMTVYLEYLVTRLNRAGGELRTADFGSLAEAAAFTGAPVIINCTGIGARRLVKDDDLVPVRGQVIIAHNPGLSEFFVGVGDAPYDFSYFFPHGDLLLLGGTEERGNWSLDPDPATAERILRGCTAIEPRLAGLEIIEHRVGLRPTRPSVRLGEESLDGRRLLHNYGHGGAGVTLSWGCAEDVAAAALGS